MKLRNKMLSVIGAIAAVGFAVAVEAAPVACGNIGLGSRTVTVDPGLVGGLCYAQNGNLQNDDIAALGLASLDKDENITFPGGDAVEDDLQYLMTSSTSGNWSFNQALWITWDRLFLGFHFGGGGDTADDNPDSFIVELSPFDFEGVFALGGGQLNGLSNIHLLGIRCDVPGCNPGFVVPEPATLLLVSLGLIGLAARTRRRL